LLNNISNVLRINMNYAHTALPF